MNENHFNSKEENRKPESFDREVQKELDRSEEEGNAVMYQSQRNKHTQAIQKNDRAMKNKTPSAVAKIAKQELSQKIKNNEPVQVVNVLAPEFYNLGFIKGSKKIPLDELEFRAGELDKNKEVVTYCANSQCSASSQAAQKLAAKGFKVRAYEGGIKEWKESGLPVE